MRAPNGDPQGEAVAEALRQGLENYVRREQIHPVQDYSLKISIHHSTGTHTWISSPILPLADWLNNREQTEVWLDKLAKQLNSAESFDAASGEFYAELLFFKNRQRGSGHRGKKGNLGTMSHEQMLKKKQCIVTIKNKDELCAPQALVTMQALANGNPQYENIKKACGQQGYLAHKLCKEAGVAEGPCGSEQMQQFQDHLGPQGNQIIVFEGQQGLIWFTVKKATAMRRAKSTIVVVRIVAVAKEPTRDARILPRSRHRKSIVVIVTVCFTDKSVTLLTSKGAFAANLKSATNVAKSTSTTRRRNMSVVKRIAAIARKRKMSIIAASFNRSKKKKKQRGVSVRWQRMQTKKGCSSLKRKTMKQTVEEKRR